MGQSAQEAAVLDGPSDRPYELRSVPSHARSRLVADRRAAVAHTSAATTSTSRLNSSSTAPPVPSGSSATSYAPSARGRPPSAGPCVTSRRFDRCRTRPDEPLADYAKVRNESPERVIRGSPMPDRLERTGDEAVGRATFSGCTP